MKINKILAAGIAATLAVTSLAAVAGAETVSQPFDMAQTYGKFELKTDLVGAELALLADAATGAANVNIVAPSAADTLTIDTTHNPVAISGITLKITGIKGTKNNASQTYSYDFDKNNDGTIWTLTSYPANSAPINKLDLSQFVEITQFSIEVKGTKSDLSKADYDTINTNWGMGVNQKVYDEYGHEYRSFVITPFSNAAGIADGKFEKLVNDQIANYTAAWGVWFNKVSDSTYDKYAFLERTTSQQSETINRNKVKLLSSAAAYKAGTLYTKDQRQIETDGSMKQTFDSDHMGTSPFWFGGLASQVADFFNKQTNGKITFNFTANSPSGSTWKNGGVPSTEVGLKSAVAGTTMGLFFNYDQSTGSLQSLGEVDGTSIVFDISDVLNDMGGLTKGNISDIYYGMNQGISYGSDDYTSIHAGIPGRDVVDNDKIWYMSDAKQHAIGYIVENVVLSYDDAADVDAAEEEVVDEPEDIDEPEDEPEEEPEDEPEEEPEDEPEDEPAEEEFTIEPEEEEEENNGDVNIIEPTNEAKADDDANPGTGVALAVVPAIVAAAAVVVSKKRK